MEFGPWDFDQMKEADVREDVIMPFLQQLGYQKGTDNDIHRDKFLSLRDAKEYFSGEKQADRGLSGEADYILEIDKSIRWVIKTISPAEEIESQTIDQACVYARHPEVSAVIYCVCNGRELAFFQTDQASESAEILRVTADEVIPKWAEIHNLLAPDQMKGRWPKTEIEKGLSLGIGLRSSARVIRGYIHYKQNTRRIPQLTDLGIAITDGIIERDKEGRIVTALKTLSPFSSYQRLLERLELVTIEVMTSDKTLSTEASTPTVFTSTRRLNIQNGEQLLNLETWREILLPSDAQAINTITATGHLQDGVFSGSFDMTSVVSVAELFRNSITICGSFELHLA